MIRLVVEGPPKGKGRPRFSRKSGHAYTPADTLSAEDRVRAAWVDAGRPRIDGPVIATVTAWFERPKSHFNTKGELSKKGRENPWPCKTPDADNLYKLATDALNKLAFKDDAFIVECRVSKLWVVDSPQTVIVLQPAVRR